VCEIERSLFMLLRVLGGMRVLEWWKVGWSGECPPGTDTIDAAEYNVATSGSRPRGGNEEREKGLSGEVRRTKDVSGTLGYAPIPSSLRTSQYISTDNVIYNEDIP
jgi:hypothetical protein